MTGIYEELIDLAPYWAADPACLFQEGIGAAWQSINGNFLLAVFGGVLLSILSLAKLISFCLETYPILVWSFFFGLIAASSLHIGKEIRWRGIGIWGALLLGISLALMVSVLRPAQLPAEWWMLSLAGAIAICAMILPGISGSFLLLLMGMYSVFLEALTTFDLVLLASFGSGCVVGLLAFSHLLSWLLNRYRDLTLALLTGFLLGSSM